MTCTGSHALISCFLSLSSSPSPLCQIDANVIRMGGPQNKFYITGPTEKVAFILHMHDKKSCILTDLYLVTLPQKGICIT